MRKSPVPLDLFRNHYVQHLRATVGPNLARYADRQPWADRPSSGGPIRLSTGLEPVVPLKLEPPAAGELKDLENAKLVYQAFPHLTPLQARDPRLWTRLTHVECWAYMRKRWDVTGMSGDEAKKQRYILEHYFVARSQSRALLHNGIARLWWYAYLTHDPGRADPFELTAKLLSYLDIAQQLLERNMGRAPGVRVAFLDFIRLNSDRLGNSSERRRACIRRLAKALNLRGGVTLLDSLDSEEVAALLDVELRLGDPV